MTVNNTNTGDTKMTNTELKTLLTEYATEDLKGIKPETTNEAGHVFGGGAICQTKHGVIDVENHGDGTYTLITSKNQVLGIELRNVPLATAVEFVANSYVVEGEM
jgi:hypothetical protein